MSRSLTPAQITLGRVLRAHGFVRDDTYTDPVTYWRDEPCGTRRIDVQLWRDSHHRVSSEVQGDGPLATHRRATAFPTEFRHATDMLSAIAAQQVVEHPRMDTDRLAWGDMT